MEIVFIPLLLVPAILSCTSEPVPRLGRTVRTVRTESPRPRPPPAPLRETEGNENGGFWNTLPVFNDLVFHGAAGIRFDREAAIRLALEDAARKAALFTRLEGRIVLYNNTGAGLLDYRSDTERVLIHDEEYQKYIERFIFDPDTDVLEENHTVFVRVRYPSTAPPDIPGGLFSHGAAKPGWIDEPPHSSGYLTGIGFAGRRTSHADTVRISYENAIFSIIRTISSVVDGKTTDVRQSGGFAYGLGESRIRAEGALTAFYVLDFWRDPASGAVWTAAIAKPAP
jgi:hypothetical protein